MLIIATAAAAVASASPAHPAPIHAGNWLVVERGQGCAAGIEFAGSGDTYLLVHKSLDGEIYIAVTNNGWSAREGKPYKISYRLNGRNYADGSTTGYRNGRARGFWSIMGAGFEQDFSVAKDLSLFLDGQFIGKLSLAGSGTAIDAMNRCVAGFRSRVEAQRHSKARGVPKDPFAESDASPPAPKKSRK
jgi:hypothetical protein